MKNALLITKNATIKKLFSLSMEKKEIALEDDISKIDDVDAVFVDNDALDEEISEKLQKTDSIKILIVGKNDEKKVGFDKYMQKPFLPTDLIELIDNLENTTHDTTDDSPKHEFELSDDLSDFDELGELDDLEEDEDKNKDNNFEDDDLLEDIDMDDLGDMDELDMDDTNIGDDMDKVEIDEDDEIEDKKKID